MMRDGYDKEGVWTLIKSGLEYVLFQCPVSLS